MHLVGPLIEHIHYQDVRNHEHQIVVLITNEIQGVKSMLIFVYNSACLSYCVYRTPTLSYQGSVLGRFPSRFSARRETTLKFPDMLG
jgi:hypothetical protein